MLRWRVHMGVFVAGQSFRARRRGGWRSHPWTHTHKTCVHTCVSQMGHGGRAEEQLGLTMAAPDAPSRLLSYCPRIVNT